MEYPQFRNAAYRHLVSCKQMLEDAKKTTTKKDKRDRLCLEIYYLSGYILETLISYAVCSSLNVVGDISQSKPFNEDSKQFKTHKLMQKYNYALKNGCNGLRNLCFFHSVHPNKEVQDLFSEWKVDFRYENRMNLKLDVLSTYIEEIKNIYETVLKNYTR